MDLQKELIAEYDREVATTRKMLEAIPADADFVWKPHAKSFTLARTAGHTAEMAGDWGVFTLTQDKLEFNADNKYAPYQPESKAVLLADFDKNVAKAKAALAVMTPEKWDANWKLIGSNGEVWVNDSKYNVWRTWVMNHMIHHRAQLGVYLRLLDKPIPGTYGPSADGM